MKGKKVMVGAERRNAPERGNRTPTMLPMCGAYRMQGTD